MAKKDGHKFANTKISRTFALANHKGTLAEWLGNGLQNRLRRFESARYLTRVVRISDDSFFIYSYSTFSESSANNLHTPMLYLCNSLREPMTKKPIAHY